MINEIGLNNCEFLQLNNNIRVSSTSSYDAQNAFENIFEDVIAEKVSLDSEQEKEEYQINFSSLGPPAGFFLDTSLLDERMSAEANLEK